MVESDATETLANGAFFAWMYIEGVALVARYGHLAMRYRLGKATLRIAEVGPRGAVEAGELHKVEGHSLIIPCPAPTADESGELGFEELHIVGVRLALIPDDSAQGEARHGGYARFVEVAGFVGVALEGILAQLNIV